MKLTKKKHEVTNCYLTHYCIEDWWPAIESNKKVYEVKKGEVIFREGDLVKGVYFVYQGNIKVHKKWGADKELILRFANGGSILGHRGLSTVIQNYQISATALENCVICFVSMDFFKSTLKVNPDFTYQLLLFFADELQESESKMRDIAHNVCKREVGKSFAYF